MKALMLVMQLMAIPGLSGDEAGVAEFITARLREAGAPAAAIKTDRANHKTPLKGNTGNLIFRLPGTTRAPRRLLMAHMDTVPVCLGAQPILDNGFVRSADPKTGCGADDRAGAAVVLAAALAILRGKLRHPPVTFFWPIQEEIGLYGARHADLGLLGDPQLAFNWDGGSLDRVTVGATGGYRMQIEVEGLASHAGVCPEQGVSAIAIAGLAIADLQRDGWHGDVRKGKRRGTSNIGAIAGGEATNVVTDRVRMKAEARSHDPAFRGRIVKAFETAFQRAARRREKRPRPARQSRVRRAAGLRGVSLGRWRAVRRRRRAGAEVDRRRAVSERQQRRPRRQLDDRPRNPDRHLGVRPDERAHHVGAARREVISRGLPRGAEIWRRARRSRRKLCCGSVASVP